MFNLNVLIRRNNRNIIRINRELKIHPVRCTGNVPVHVCIDNPIQECPSILLEFWSFTFTNKGSAYLSCTLAYYTYSFLYRLYHYLKYKSTGRPRSIHSGKTGSNFTSRFGYVSKNRKRTSFTRTPNPFRTQALTSAR